MPRRSASDLDIVAAITAAQSGVITARQLTDAGVRRSTIQHRVRTGGPWRRLLPGVYLVGGAPDRGQQRTAALLYAGPAAVITGRDALALHQVARPIGAVDEPLHVLVPHGTHRSSTGFVVVERTRRPVVPLRREGHSIAPVARAVVDAARRMHRRADVAALASRAVQAGFATIDDLDAETSAAHRRSTALIREVMVDIRAGTRSAPEADLRRLWLASGLREPLWNPRLSLVGGGFLACPDAYVADVGVAVEVDSVEFHFAPVDWRRTMERQARMTAHGIVVIATPPSRISKDGDRLMREIASTIRSHEGRATPPLRIAPPTGR